MERPLTLSEKIYLLAIHPLKGGIIMSAGSSINFVLAGALLLELQREENIVIDDKRFSVRNTFSDSPIHRFVLSKVKNPGKPRRITFFISRLTFSGKEMINHIRRYLIDYGIIRLKEKQFLYFFRWKVPELVKRNVVFNLIEEIERQTLGADRDSETTLLLSLIMPAGLLRRIFTDKQKRIKARKTLKEITGAYPVARAVQEAIRRAHAARVAATV